ncbi:MAG: alanine--tRNA ligase [Clostridiales bacterium]|nr:alanine--tRNA ligase [Clostridiales bacterium]
MGLNEVREKYLSFFESKGHLRLPSYSLVPANDKSLLLINSGMAPMKTFFTGQETPPHRRVVTCQKCVRTIDIENVGKTARHGTFFEMLGNFSFGDYFKEDAITWGWELLTKVYGIPRDRLHITVYEEDGEAFDIWTNKIGLDPAKIHRFGKSENFWQHGAGPCGPCSEIHYDNGEEYGCGKDTCGIDCDCDRYLEIWNLVFTQYNANDDGTYSELASKNIDTGMGLERVAALLQGVDTIFDVDTIRSIRDKVCEYTGKAYHALPSRDVSIRLITDHIRSIIFLMADGVTPSNERRGYVLRRLLRRAARHVKLLGGNTILAKLCDTAIDTSGEAYPELKEKREYIKKMISVEEERFNETIDQGLAILRDHVERIKQAGETTLDGARAFQLYDTFGFPLELMGEILEEEGLQVDKEAFANEMQKQRTRARAARETTDYMGADKTVYHQLGKGLTTEFSGYDKLETDDATVLALVAKGVPASVAEGEDVSVIIDRTPFYAESGGQKGDSGKIVTDTGVFEVQDTIKVIDGKIAHVGRITSGQLSIRQPATATVDKARRDDTRRNHTATHLLQKALREVLGPHVEQAGSSVSAERLRFDFTHFSALTDDELKRVEDIVNDKILEGLSVCVSEMSQDEARKKGAMALFGEKYGERVRVVQIGGFSMELCGGTHLDNTSQAGLFKIISESGVAAGVRRIEAVTGRAALKLTRDTEDRLREVAILLRSAPEELTKRAQHLLDENNRLKRDIESLNAKDQVSAAGELLKQAVSIGSISVVTGKTKDMDASSLRAMSDKIRDKADRNAESLVVILCNEADGKVQFLVSAGDNAIAKGVHSGELVKLAARICGGGGGGRPNMAQAGGRDAAKADEALAAVLDQLKASL